MSKWPKHLAKELNQGVRSRLLPIFAQHGFAEFPIGGGEGKFYGGSYDTDLFRAAETNVDIVSIYVLADGFHSLSVSIEAVRAVGNVDRTRRLPGTSAFPIDSRYALCPRATWRNFLNRIFTLGPPWPNDRDTAVQGLIDQIADRLPLLFGFVSSGRDRYLLGTKFVPRQPFPAEYQVK